MKTWAELKTATKLNILAGESLVMFELLTDCSELLLALNDGCDENKALEIIGRHF